MSIIEKFLKYINIPTNSNSETRTSPSTSTQWNLAKELVHELKKLQMDEVYFDT